jgi:hypothetical protein
MFSAGIAATITCNLRIVSGMNEKNGLTCAWILDGAGGGRQVGRDAAKAFRSSGDDWLWLHFAYSSLLVRNWLHAHSGLSDLTVETFSQTETRPRVLPADSGLRGSMSALFRESRTCSPLQSGSCCRSWHRAVDLFSKPALNLCRPGG